MRQRLGPLALVVSIAVTRGIVTSCISTFWPLLHEHCVSALLGSSTVIALMLLSGAVGNVLGGNASDRVAPHLLLAVTTVAAALSLGGFAMAHGPWIYVFAALSGLFGNSGFAVTTVMGQDLMPERVAAASGPSFGLANGLTSGVVALLALTAAAWGVRPPFCSAPQSACLAFRPRSRIPACCAGRVGAAPASGSPAPGRDRK